MKNILVAVGNSQYAVGLLQYAIDFAEQFDAQILLTQSFGTDAGVSSMANINRKLAENTQRELDELLEQVDSRKVPIRKMVVKSPIITSIKQIDKEMDVDLIILSARSTDIRDEVYLGTSSGSIIKKTNIPALIVPRGTTFSPFSKILTAFKSGRVDNEKKLKWLFRIQKKFQATVDLLLVKTPEYSAEDSEINAALKEVSSEQIVTENATTYLGVLEKFEQKNPDLLVVFRRKRGFFHQLWEKNTILKKEFNCPVPLLVLSAKL